MSITAYSRFRRQGLKQAWSLAAMSKWCGSVGTGLVVLLLVYALVGWLDAVASERDTSNSMVSIQKVETVHMEGIVVACLNNGGMWIDGEYYTCRVKSTGIKRSWYDMSK